MGQLVLIALATFVSEDLTCLAAGSLVAAGKLGFVPAVAACAAGIYLGDILLYLAGRVGGGPIVRRLVTEQRLERARQWLSTRGAVVVLISRFTPGLRLPTYVAAGLLKTDFWAFNLYFLVAALAWTPLLVASAALFGRGAPRIGLALLPLLLLRMSWRTRRRIVGRLRRIVHWEFWPPWLAYLPLVPYILWLGLKHRSLTLFTAANPGIPTGGFVGESKSQILAYLPQAAAFHLIPAGARDYLPPELPIVLKPDVGERGTGVLVARSAADAARYLEGTLRPTIAQQYVGGLEFGVFYCRRPELPEGEIVSITEKRFPEVVGDGRSSVADLVLRDSRAVCLAHVYDSSDRIPQAGERVRLVEIGSHCRGTMFLDGSRHLTAELRSAIDRAAASHPGFYFGRFDLRTPSIADFQAGRFQILELNGVGAEPTHIYDPAVSLFETYRVLFRHWRLAFEIGAANRAKGARPTSLSELVRAIRGRNRGLVLPGRPDHQVCLPRPAVVG